ncbi:HmuY family protein [Chitinophaga sp. sic0106]|uniref:HmuY family protein n=1 Tax=Chitinophaga sp. sic0106 TaxID=2854785 RepID=UPI001C4960D9|nr:HmuY family protein [Chitinophaga sp. sic0106]MBV7532249.1 HmuY family protein [Chitinophaga sp. sic0106]
MKFLNKLTGISAVALTIFATSCSKSDDDNTTAPVVELKTITVTNLAADTANKGSYTLYSLADNKVIANSDSASSKWDIGFKATSIIINGGVSGPGKAVGQVVSGVFTTLAEAPAAGYVSDSTGNLTFKSWYSYNATTHIISTVPGKVLIIKTPGGKYAKVEILSYYKDAPANPDLTSVSRLYKFQYVLQTNGTTKF